MTIKLTNGIYQYFTILSIINKEIIIITIIIIIIIIKWITKKMRNPLRLKSKNLHPACVICEGVYTCKEN